MKTLNGKSGTGLRGLPHNRAARANQHGASLFVALVALAIMTLAGLALIRSVDTGNLIAGNFAFKEATVHAADTGIEAAVAYLNATVAVAPDTNLPAGCAAGTCQYYARTQPEDSKGMLTGINWGAGGVPSTTLNGSYGVQYVIDRLCNPDPAVAVALGTNPTLATAAPICYTGQKELGGSKKGGIGPGVSPTGLEVFYRVTVRVAGPRDTVTTLQTVLGR